jgi:sugar diacid utilization regulator
MYQQAKITMKVGALKSPDASLYAFEDYLPLQIFGLAADHAPLEIYLHPVIEEIDLYDKAHNTDFVKTLRALALNMFNKTLAAKKLNIHPNTLSYRLNKIGEVFTINFNDPEMMRTLLCNFLMIESVTGQ